MSELASLKEEIRRKDLQIESLKEKLQIAEAKLALHKEGSKQHEIEYEFEENLLRAEARIIMRDVAIAAIERLHKMQQQDDNSFQTY